MGLWTDSGTSVRCGRSSPMRYCYSCDISSLWHAFTTDQSHSLKSPPTPRLLHQHFSLLRPSHRRRRPAADSPAMSLFVLVMDSNLPLSSESLGDWWGRKFTFFSPLPLSFNRARGTSSSYSSDNVRCSFFFLPLAFFIVAFFCSNRPWR